MGIKLFGKNAVVYSIGNVGLRAASLILIPIYTHSLSMKNYGLLMTLLLTIELMIIVMNCGMNLTLIRFVKEHEKSNQISNLLSTSYFMNLAGGLVLTGASLIFFVPFFRNVLHSDEVRLYIGFSCCISLLDSLIGQVVSYYRAQNESIKFMTAGVLKAVFLIVVTYIFLCVLNMGIRGALFARIIVSAIFLLFLSFNVFSRTGFKISFAIIPKLVKYGLPLAFSMLGMFVIQLTSVYFLSLLSGLEAVAIYSLGFKLAMILEIVIIYPFQLSFAPFVFANVDEPYIKKQMARLLSYLMLATTVVAFCILFVSRFLLRLIAPPEYSSAYTVILLLLPGMSFVGIKYFAETLLGIVRKTNVIGLITIVCALFSLPLNYILISILGWYGAIIVFNVSLILISVTMLVVGIKKFPVPIEWRRLSLATGLFVLFFFTFFIMRDANPILFTGLTLLVALSSTLVIFNFRFFHYDEIIAIKNLILKLR